MKKVKLIALITAVIAGVCVYLFFREIGKPAEVPRTEVVTALQNIPENTKITEEMVALKPVANEALQQNHMLDLESVIGMVASEDIFAGEQIVTNRLVRTGEYDENKNALAYVIGDNMRAITISVNTVSGLENMLKPGNRVDLILHYSYEREIETEEAETSLKRPVSPEAEDTEETSEPEKEKVTVASMFLQNVRILAVGSVLQKDGSFEYATVTLETTPEDALKLSFAEYSGSIRLILRSPLDEQEISIDDVELDTLRKEEDEP